MKQKIFINKQTLILHPSQLIQSGGEGMVFAIGDTAVKIYHQPQPHQAHKLRHLLNLPLPPDVLGPCALVQEEQGKIIGFQMAKLPDSSQPLKQLANPLYWQKNNIQTQAVLHLFHDIHHTLSQLHQANIIAGDLNDQNIFFSPPSPSLLSLSPLPSPLWIDADSFQFAHYACPVANLNFLDPALYHVSDFSQRPFFTLHTDWYAYFVLLIKSLLQLHPYGGTHKQHKSLQARVQAGISILDTTVTYPPNARHPESLSDDLLHHLHLVFDKGHREPFPLYLLTTYANNLTDCPQCSLAYPRQRPSCPTCHHQTSVTQPPTLQLRKLLPASGFIEHVAIQANGRILVVTRLGNLYKLFRLGIGGTVEEMLLFNGQPGYRCASFDHFLVVNSPQSKQLLILDISGPQPQKVTMLATADFRGMAAVATTPQHLYRIAGNWIMRGSLQNGLYVEDALTTAHKAQTQFFGSPYSDLIAGYHRIFAQTHYFLIDQHGASYDLLLPTLPVGATVPKTAIAFSRDTVAVIRKVGVNGRYTSHTHISNHKGQIIRTIQTPSDSLDALAHHYPYTTTLQPDLHPLPPSLHADEQTRLYQHPSGLLLHQADQSLWFLPNIPKYLPNWPK
jgi:serine/threonine protein kinase